MTTTDRAIRIVEGLLASEFPDAEAAIVGGSFIEGKASEYSDIDVVVIKPSVEAGYREVFPLEGIAVETFVQDHETLRFFLEQDRSKGRPVLLRLVADGLAIGTHPENALRWQEWARKLLADGPPPLEERALEHLFHAITDRLDDIRVHRSLGERLALSSELYSLVSELVLRRRNRWTGNGKWAARLLEETDINFADSFHQSLKSLIDQEDSSSLIALIEKELKEISGKIPARNRQASVPGNRTPGGVPNTSTQ